jgi:hypothetical protein
MRLSCLSELREWQSVPLRNPVTTLGFGRIAEYGAPPLPKTLDLTTSVREQLLNLVAAIRPLIRQYTTSRVNDMGSLLFCQRMLNLVSWPSQNEPPAPR